MTVLDRQDPSLDLFLCHYMTGLAHPVDVEERAPHPVVAHLEGPHAFVGHMAVGTGHASPRMNALLPHLELGMLGLQDLGARVGVYPVGETLLVIVRFDVV